MTCTAQTQRDPNLKGNTSIPTFDPAWRPDSSENWDDDSKSGDVINSNEICTSIIVYIHISDPRTIIVRFRACFSM